MPQLPQLPLAAWLSTKTTLHLYLQIIGKLKLQLMPRKNHWWNITLHVNSKGLSTLSMPYADGHETCEIQFNFRDHRLELSGSSGVEESFPLQDGLTVADFYRQIKELLRAVDIELDILAKPYDLPITQPFAQITDYHHYDPVEIGRFWHILRWVHHVFNEFSGQFYGKTCPVHLYWHSFDLVVTRFSGEPAPPMPPEARISDKDAYSHENSSFGFWPGDDNVPEPSFYSYTYPAPAGMDEAPLQPAAAQWVDANGSPMALLSYHELLKEKDPRAGLLAFLESAYRAGATRADWPVEVLRVPPLSEL
jgi:hypothetical protein